MLSGEFLYLSDYSLCGEPSFGGFFDGAWLYSKRFSLLKSFLSKTCFLDLDFDSLLEFKLLLKILDLGDQIEVNYKYYWKKINRKVAS